MKPLILALAVMYPLSLWAGSGDPRPLDTWELVWNSLKFDVGTILSQAGEGGEPIPTESSVTLELYAGNYYKLSIITEAAEGYSFPHFLPGPPAPSPLPSSKAAAGFGYYSMQSDTLRFNAHFLRLFADGEDLEEILQRSGDARALEEYKLVLSFVNGLFLELFNDLYAYESGDRLVFLLPGRSRFAAGAGDPAAGVVWELQRAGAPPASSSTVVEATVLGDAVEGLTVEFARAIAGRWTHYAWSAVTDSEGRLALTISSLEPRGASGYYKARARNGAGTIVGRWHSIPLNRDRRQVLELTLGGGARVVSSERLDTSRVAVASEPEPPGLVPNVPNPFNPSTVIPYRLDTDGPVRLDIYNLFGQHIRTLVDEVQAAGAYRVSWDARDGRGAGVATGVYFIRLHHPGGVHTRRMLYLK